MGLDRKRRRLALKQRFQLLSGGKAAAAPDPKTVVELAPADRLGMAVLVLVEQFRTDQITRADEVRVLLDVAAKLAIDLDADAEQFGNGAAFVYAEMEKKLAEAPAPEAG